MRIRVSHLKDRKQRRERFAVLTAYDATMARLLERAGVDVLLVGDSVATAVLGYDTTLPVTLDVMIHHTAAVVRGTENGARHRRHAVSDLSDHAVRSGAQCGPAVEGCGRCRGESRRRQSVIEWCGGSSMSAFR